MAPADTEHVEHVILPGEDASEAAPEATTVAPASEAAVEIIEAEAAAAVPDELCDLRALVGPPERIRERYRAWESSGATGLLIRTAQDAAIDLMAEVAGSACG